MNFARDIQNRQHCPYENFGMGTRCVVNHDDEI